MAILENEILIGLGGSNTRYFEGIGYDIPRQKDKYGNFRVTRGSKILVKISDIPNNSNVLLTKVCDNCDAKIPNQPYQSIIEYRRNGKDYCNKCCDTFRVETRKNNVDYKKSLEYYAKENNKIHLLEEFSEKNIKRPFEISYGTVDSYLWNCKKCESEYPAIMNNRTLGNTKCPYCTGRKVNHTNSLFAIYPEISKQWHPTKNGNLTPLDIVGGAKRDVWWLCEKGHEWEAKVENRAKHDAGCPYCSGNKVSIENCLGNVNPNLAKEWHPTKNGNITPYDIGYSSGKKVWWKCKEGHEWKSTVGNRNNGTRCPRCKESKGEQKIRNFLEVNSIKFFPQYEFEGLTGLGGKNLKFDFVIISNCNSPILLIEYDGEFHFHKVYDDDSHERLKLHDQLKNTYCKEKNIPLIRIPYWEFDNIEYILNNILAYYKLTNIIEYDNNIIHRFLVNHPEYITPIPPKDFKN